MSSWRESEVLARSRVREHARAPASQTRTSRGGRSGPSVGDALTADTTVPNTVDVTTGAGTASPALRMAPTGQQDAQALHV